MIGWPFGAKKLANAESTKSRDVLRDLKVLESQRALLEAATSTADAANFVTTRLRQKLEDSMAQIENTARILNDALVICDLNGNIQAFNPAAERMFAVGADYVRNSFVGSLFKSSTASFDKGEDVWELLTNIAMADEDDTLHGILPDGTEFPLDVNHTRLDRSDGSSIMLLVLRSVDTTPESSKLRNYRSIFEGSFDGILVVENRRIVAANPAATILFGYTVEDLLSKTLDVLFISEEQPDLHSDTVDHQYAARHYDGYLMDLYFTTTTIQWNGSPASLVTIRNVTNSVKTTENMICCFDSSFVITFANYAFGRFYGLKRENLVGMDIRSLMPDDECNTFLINIGSLTTSEPTRRMQLCTTSKEGDQRIQCWTDHASYDEVEVEYQRIGYCTVTSKDRP